MPVPPEAAPSAASDGRLDRLWTALRTAGVEVDTGRRRTAEYAYDASNYRVRPAGVVFPADAGEVVTVLRHCRAAGVPVTGRGGGTSMAGNAVGAGVVLDFSRRMNRVLHIDEAGGWADVQPGVVLGTLARRVQDATAGRLTFAPDPSSASRATVGGAVGNDACGNHSVRHGRTSDHVLSLDLVTADGQRLTARPGGLTATDPDDAPAAARAAELNDALRDLARRHLGAFRLELGRIARQVSGFHLAHLLPENGFDVARALVGSEGTCALVVAARVRLVPAPGTALLLSLGYADVVDAARDVPAILEYRPAAVEGVDEVLVATMRGRRGEDAVRGLPDGRAWLYVDLDGDDPDAVATTAAELLDRLRADGRLVDGRVVADPAERAALWRVREDGAGLTALLPSGEASWPGWEDSAVAPERLADYLADFRDLLARHRLSGVMYGHFGAGCMHVRITFDLRTAAGRAVMRAFLADAARLVVAHGGSLSGEHGDGRARSELLPLMYSAELMAAFERFKRLWDPDDLLNPGTIVDPPRADEALALADVPAHPWPTSFDLAPAGAAADGARPDTGGDGTAPLVRAVQSCVGIGRCRSTSGGVMCPSYRATLDEKDSTRGRARVLQDMVRGAANPRQGWRSTDVREALDLCLSCKACSHDCPTGVDMATYKAEFLSQHYRRRLRPVSHYTLGWLPRWLRFTERLAPLVNAALTTRLGTLGARLGGVAPRRVLPRFASRAELRRQLAPGTTGTPAPAEPDHPTGEDPGTGPGAPPDGVVLLVDSFTRGFRPEVAGAALRVLGGAVRKVDCRSDVCCGLTWTSTGQLGTAAKRLRRAAEALDDGTDRPIVVIEPSCAAALRKDLPELVGTDAARRVAARVRSFATMVTELAASGWRPRPRTALPAAVTVQTHCHEYAVFGAATQRKALAAVGVQDVGEAVGCCGVAGNFGFETRHFDISMQVAEQALAPAMRTHPDRPLLTDGFSCRMQARQLDSARTASHLAELLDPGRADPAAADTAPAVSAAHRPTGVPSEPGPPSAARTPSPSVSPTKDEEP